MMKLRYKIISCTSQDPNFPVSNLLTNQHHWESARFPTYPQQITLMFYQPTVIKSIKIISNFNKIPQKISILYHLPTVDNQTQFTKLGFVKFSNPQKGQVNSNSESEIRQVKKINNLSLKALYLRLIIYKNYPHKNNFFNQVALSAIILQGSGYDLHHIKLKNNSQIFLNNFIDKRINILNQFKEKCIQNEQFNEANQIKLIIQHIRVLSNKITDLNLDKIEFIKEENYDQAKVIKAKVQKIKGEIEDIANNFYDPNKKTIKNYSFLNNFPQNKSTLANDFNNQFITIQNQKQNIQNHQKAGTNQDEYDSQQQSQNQSMNDSLQHNNKVVPALLNKLKNSKVSEKEGQQSQFNQRQEQSIPAQPQQMSPSNQANASCLTQFYQKVIIKKLHSKYWQFRLQALTFIQNQCKSSSATKIGKSKLRAYIFVYNKLIKQINKQIIGLNIQLMNSITNLKLDESEFKTELFLELEKSVIQTLNVIQNSQNMKVKNQGQKVILRMIDSSIFGPQIIYNSIHRAYNEKLASKIKIIYLQNLQYMVSKYGVNTNGIPVTICDFAIKKSVDPNNQVRKAVFNLLKSIKQGGGQQRIKKCISQDQTLKNSYLLKQLKL